MRGGEEGRRKKGLGGNDSHFLTSWLQHATISRCLCFTTTTEHECSTEDGWPKGSAPWKEVSAHGPGQLRAPTFWVTVDMGLNLSKRGPLSFSSRERAV